MKTKSRIFSKHFQISTLLLMVWTGGVCAQEADPGKARLVEILGESLRSYETIADYHAIFHKQERDGNELGVEEKIYLKFEKPFKIYMKWLNTAKNGLQVFYERGQYKGKLVIHKPGLFFGLAPVLFLDQNSPWVRQGSASYNIEDAGIGTFLHDFSKAVLRASDESKLLVHFLNLPSGEEEADVTFADSTKDSVYFAYRVVVVFDPENRLPTVMKLYDWQNKPMGIYTYEHLKLNVGPNDEEFRKEINNHLYKVYNHQD